MPKGILGLCVTMRFWPKTQGDGTCGSFFAPKKNNQMKLIPKSKLKKVSIDSARDRAVKFEREGKNPELIQQLERIWASMQEWRDVRFRNIRYVYKPGGQWEDLVKDDDNHLVTEKSRIEKRTGGIALQNNHLFKIVTSMVGSYTKQDTMPVVYASNDESSTKSKMMTNVLQKNYDNMKVKVLLSNELSEAIVGGMPVMTVEWGPHRGHSDTIYTVIDPSQFYFRSKCGDPRHFDVDLIGDFRDYSKYELIAALQSYGTPWTLKEIESVYNGYFNENDESGDQFNQHAEDHMSFYGQLSPRMLRAYHVWTLDYKSRYQVYDPMDMDRPLYKIETSDVKAIEQMNAERLSMGLQQGLPEDEIPLIEYKPIIDQYWHFQILAPDGTILHSQDSPYEHEEHPYVFMAYHFINGNIYPYISVIIDQQRYINRLITLHDLAVSSSIKGLKMVPKTMLGGLTPEQFAKKAVEIGGWIFYDPDPQFPNLMPQVITSNSTNIGTGELLQLEMQFINDLSAVSDALQGKKPSAGTSASRYEMEVQNSTSAISPLLVRFAEFENELATKAMQVIHQYYTDPVEITQKHANGYVELSMYEPKEVQDIKYETAIKESATTPVARMMMNAMLERIWEKGEINAKQLLSMGYYPGSEEIVMELGNMEQQVQQGQIPQVPLGIMDQVSAGANQNTVDMMKQALMS